jgi:phosphatidylserine decarboxylase
VDRRRLPVAVDAWPMLAGGIILGLLLSWFLGPKGWIFPGALILFTLFFFRNPHRQAKCDPQDVLSPADGVIMSVQEVEEERYIKGPAVKISIFLSVLNVHMNRCPVAGEVEYVAYQAGKFLPAFKSHASEINERNYIGLRSSLTHSPQYILLVQITGFVARRIVCWAKTGDHLEQGERFGLIKFGSCTELYLPRGSEIYAEKGMKVRGGLTVLGRLADE